MHRPILHHYDGSPYAEKIRSILAFKRAPFCSVKISPVLPRPALMRLTAGHRRTPVLQVGADIYCDTRCITSYIDRTYPAPPLLPRGSRAVSDLMAFWAEPRLFVAMAPLRFTSPADVTALFGGEVSAEDFALDRRPFMRDVLDVGRARELWPAAYDQVRTFLSMLECRLGESAFVAGDAPSAADFSAYHLVWWLEHAPRVDAVLENLPRLRAWVERVGGLGLEDSKPLTQAEALEIARVHEPERVADAAQHGEHAGRVPGRRVRICSDDYGRDPVEGELVAATDAEVVIARSDGVVGRLHVHFPRIGFQILPCSDVGAALPS